MVSLLLLLAACGGSDESAPVDATPEGAARALLAARTTEDGIAEPWDTLFDPPNEGSTTDLLQALEALPATEEVRILTVELSDDGNEAFVDMEARIEGEGTAGFSARLRAREPSRWRVIWFHGPGLEWPVHAARGDGLSQSAPPGGPTR
jgi:hypothetical protein